MARHRAVSDRHRWRRSSAQAMIPVPRRPGIELVDGITQVRHRVSSDALHAGRQRGDYVALCGVRLLAASLTDPGRGQCPGCAS
ncbi:MAG: hypothetical protein ACRDS0_06975 [Pseudonocardiaceae bacterium]